MTVSGYRGEQPQPSHGYQAAVISRQESHPVINNTSPALVAQALSGTENIFLEKHFIIRLNLGFFVFLYLSKLVSSC